MAKVLVIDDIATIRKSVELSFKGATNPILDFAASGEEGIRRAFAGLPDLVLLDFVLPDMKGPDVCRRLAADKRTAATPILLLTGKDGAVMDQFRPFPTVFDYIHKPFDPAELRARVQVAIKSDRAEALGGTAQGGSSEPGPSFQSKEVAARAIYSLMKERLSSIPQWMAQLGDQPAAAFIARKLFTPELLDEVIGTLAPLMVKDRGGYPPVISDVGHGEAPEPAALVGTLGALAGLDVLRLVTSMKGNFLLGVEGKSDGRADSPSARTMIYLRQGRVCFATETDPETYGHGLALDEVGSATDGAQFQARAEQRRSGKPFPLALAEHGSFPASELPRVLREQGMRTLRRALAATSGTFEVTEMVMIPAYVEAYAHPIPFAQIELAVTRDILDEAQIAALVPGPDAVFARCDGFSRLVPAYDWATDERRLLAALDGGSTVAELAVRLGLSTEELLPTLAAFVRTGLVRPVAPATNPQRKILVVDKAGSSFTRDLRGYLEGNPGAPTLVELTVEDDLLPVLERERPFLLILNGPVETLVSRARGLSALPAARSLTLATVIDGGSESDSRRLLVNGFNVVLRKPLHVADLEGLLKEAHATLAVIETSD